MRRMLALVAMLVAMGACRDSDRVRQPPTLLCPPCSGKGATIAVAAPRPVPLAVINTWKLCFAETAEERCWYDCPDGQRSECIDQ